MTKPVVFLSQPIHPAGIERLKQHCEVIEGVYHPVASDAEIEAALARADRFVDSLPHHTQSLPAPQHNLSVAALRSGVYCLDPITSMLAASTSA